MSTDSSAVATLVVGSRRNARGVCHVPGVHDCNALASLPMYRRQLRQTVPVAAEGTCSQSLRSSLKLTSDSTDDGFLDPERIRVMEEIIHHYTGRSEFDKSTLVQYVGFLRGQHNLEGRQFDEISDEGADSPGENEEFTIDPVSSTTASKPALKCFVAQLTSFIR